MDESEYVETRKLGTVESSDLMLITDKREVDTIASHIGLSEHDYGGALVNTHEGDYSEVWFFRGSVAYNYKTAYKYI